MADILDTYLAFTDGTEPPIEFHRWSFISCVAAALGRNVWVRHGHSLIYPNMFALLVGVPGTRKSTAIKSASALLRESGYTKYAFTKTSREKFLLDFEEGFEYFLHDGSKSKADRFLEALGSPVKRENSEAFICADEFADFIGVGNFNFVSTLTTLWDNLPEYSERLKNSKSVRIDKPVVNMLGGMTPTSLAQCMPASVVGQGFMSRIILVFGQPPHRKITWPEPPNKALQDIITQFFAELSKLNGEFVFSQEAKVLTDQIYQSWENLSDIRLQYYGARRLTHLMKLCIVCAAMNLQKEITVSIVEQANTILTNTENSMHNALGEFGDARSSSVTQKVMETLINAPTPLLVEDVWKAVSTDIERYTNFLEILSNLRRANKIVSQFERMDDGTETALITVNRTSLRRSDVGINMARWIKEHNQPIIPS